MARNSALRRLMKELKTVQDEGPQADVILQIEDPNDPDGLYHWKAWICGPVDTPYEGGYFKLEIDVPSQYPLAPPTVKFATSIFHPNVHFKTGEICLDLLKTAWSAVYTLQSVCRSIISLLAHPEADSPLNCDCGNLLRAGDAKGYWALARLYTRLHGSFVPPVTLAAPNNNNTA